MTTPGPRRLPFRLTIAVRVPAITAAAGASANPLQPSCEG
ncbi:hypothetical protein BJY16_001779 [Actinoplanes octamycinicus]|uniref:Uncharacterized protein n=1 Tax=Actinoplanes octamycinicus TaxID=135948 RepID=A0A7W7GU43_9ACTN|nr:hypothetical protein [Actinoplanes octamycinicus]